MRILECFDLRFHIYNAVIIWHIIPSSIYIEKNIEDTSKIYCFFVKFIFYITADRHCIRSTTQECNIEIYASNIIFYFFTLFVPVLCCYQKIISSIIIIIICYSSIIC